MNNKLIVLVILILSVFNSFSFNDGKLSSLSDAIINNYDNAEKAFLQKDYKLAAEYFGLIKLEADRLTPASHFKYAFALYQSGAYDFSLKNFESLEKSYPEYLLRYNTFFRIKNLWKINSNRAVYEAEKFIASFPKTALADSLLLPVADYYFTGNKYIKARNYYLLHAKWKVDKRLDTYASIRAAQCLYFADDKKGAREAFVQILRNHESAEECFKFVQWLEDEEQDLYKQHFFKVVDVYFQNEQYNQLRNILERYIQESGDDALKEKARFNLVKLYFAKGQYVTALYGFENLLGELKNKTLEPHLRLYLARIYLRQGLKQKAVDAYTDYAQRFPRRRIAPEAAWKAAWVSEELKDLQQALDLYRLVRNRWSNSSYARDAYFREGFTLYRQGKITEALNVFNEIRYKRWPDIDKHRAHFWASLCMDGLNKKDEARKARIELAQNLWDDYYTMKSFLMHKNDLDAEIEIFNNFNQRKDPLVEGAKDVAGLLKNFENVFEVKNILGEQYALGELEDITLTASTLKQWVALAEIYKKLGVYGKAFRTYDYINRKFFADIPFSEKGFILKERFPFYYDGLVEKHSYDLNIEPELVLALMKQESVFDFKAHSWANAYGLMQLIPSTAKAMAVLQEETFSNNNKLFDPEFNIKLGILYLKQLSNTFSGQKELVLAAYNAGPHRVTRWKTLPGSEQIDVFIENVEFHQTRDYVRKVMKNYWAYKLLQSNFQIESEELLLGSLSD